jgi:hypothetical protein
MFIEAQGISVGTDNPYMHSLWTRLVSAGTDRENVHFADLFIPGERANTIIRALLGSLAMPHFRAFIADALTLYDTVRRTCSSDDPDSGAVYETLPIQELCGADPDAFGVSIVTVDGQMLNMGDTSVDFPLMAAVRPLLV